MRWDPQLHPHGRDGRWSRIAERAEHVDVTAAHAGPMTDAVFAEGAARVERVVGAARKTLATDITHSADGAWHPDRDRVHREIVDSMYAAAAHVPNDGHAVIAGGLGGAGKTTVLTKHAGVDTSQYLTINPDDIKEELARRDMMPTVPGHEDLSPMERAQLVHEESSRIAHMLADKAYRDRKNVMWDITMSSGSSVKTRMTAMRRAGYTNINGVFVDIPTEVSVQRAMGRYRRGVDKYRQGVGQGGRYVAPDIIRAQHTTGGTTINREVFDGMRGQFDQWSTFDNSVDGRAPQLVDRSR